jgi:cation:H+ antiporter
MIFVALVGAAMTCVYVLGILERADRTVLGIGWDSALALVLYVGGTAVLYTMR